MDPQAEIALADERRKVAALEAEHRKTAEALQALEQQQREANKQPGALTTTAPATGAKTVVDTAFASNPLIGFKSADAFTISQQLLQHTLRHLRLS